MKREELPEFSHREEEGNRDDDELLASVIFVYEFWLYLDSSSI